MRFYCGVSEQNWNHHPVTPGPYACVAPKHGRSQATQETTRVQIPPGTQVLQDSSAFSDGPDQRLSFEAALERQIAHAERFDYTNQITHRASYDRLIRAADEAESAIQETIDAARFIAKHNGHLGAILTV